ncbi:hypothetical protein [Actinoplanes auranticolor]|uniref:Uncharacterized protein n=1 Tax=Actinoplanes auranticolor TaxID=47988 RepID=A0A919SIC1_9ACTN|nr:hypothetical protein [Actinoplanes auranticolor]GIM72047.1 hypothetical protein Aau02nite_49010 [Actinoplanes auranticolor]
MKAEDIRRWLPLAVMAVLVGTAFVMAVHRGPAWGALVAAVVGALLLFSLVRHQLRATTMDNGEDSRTDNGRG